MAFNRTIFRVRSPAAGCMLVAGCMVPARPAIMRPQLTMRLHLWLLPTIVCTAAATAAARAGAPAEDRRVYAWASGGSAEKAAAQLRNRTWRGLLTGVHAFCGVSFADGAIVANRTQLSRCDPLHAAANETGVEFHVALGTVPEAAIDHPESFIASAAALAVEHGWQGFNIDDESSCAPRSTIANLTR